MKNRSFFLEKFISAKSFTYRVILKELLPVFRQIKKNKKGTVKILDAGCGEGNISLFLSQQDPSVAVTGIDISEKSINISQTRLKKIRNRVKKNIKFIKTEIEKYKTEGDSFDLILLTEVIEHVYNDEIVIKKLYSLLGKEGVLFLSTPSKNAPLYKLKIIRKYDKRVGHLRRYSQSDIEAVLVENNFKILKTIKTEGIIRNFLFFTHIGKPMLKLANNFSFVSDFLTFLDNISLKIFGESQIIVVAQKT